MWGILNKRRRCWQTIDGGVTTITEPEQMQYKWAATKTTRVAGSKAKNASRRVCVLTWALAIEEHFAM